MLTRQGLIDRFAIVWAIDDETDELAVAYHQPMPEPAIARTSSRSRPPKPLGRALSRLVHFLLSVAR
jgi:hypothetical protein